MALQRKAAPVAEGFNLGDLANYAGGFALAPGAYVWTDLTVKMYKHEKSTGPARLSVIITMQPLGDPNPGSAKEVPYSMGSKADQSFVPNPDTGKGIVPIAGAPAATLNDQTNWMLLLNSLYNSGLPQGILTNDLSVLEGIHVEMNNVDEPAERKAYVSATAEVGGAPRRDNKVAVVVEIKDDGKPWEGTGGLPEADAAPKVVSAKPVRVAAKPAPAPAPEPEASGEGVDVQQAALDGIGAVLDKNPKGLSKSLLRTSTFNAVKSSQGEDVANAVISEVFDAGEPAISKLLAVVGFSLTAGQVKPV